MAMSSKWSTTEILLTVGGSILVIGAMLFLAVSIAVGQVVRLDLNRLTSELSDLQKQTGQIQTQETSGAAPIEELKRKYDALLDNRSQTRLLLVDSEKWERRRKYLEDKAPHPDHLESIRNELAEELRRSSLALKLTIANQSPFEIRSFDSHNEIGADMTVEGDQDKLLQWLLSLQGTEKFMALKTLDLEMLPGAGETPRARCRLALASYFNPNVTAVKK